MKKTILLIILAFVSMIAQAQILETVSMQQIASPKGEQGKVVGISPKGDYLLVTDANDQGIQCIDLVTKEVTTICDAEGAGWDVKISPNGKTITYRSIRYEGLINKQDILQYNFEDKKVSMMAKSQSGTEFLVDGTANATVSINEDLQLVLNRNGKRVVLAPNGNDQAYNWPSISPDGSKILYYVSGRGCFVCDLKGENVRKVANHCRAPKWYDNNTIVGMADEDDGKFLTASAIVVYTLDGKNQILVAKDMMAIYPHVADGKVAFSTAGGEMYLMEVK